MKQNLHVSVKVENTDAPPFYHQQQQQMESNRAQHLCSQLDSNGVSKSRSSLQVDNGFSNSNNAELRSSSQTLQLQMNDDNFKRPFSPIGLNPFRVLPPVTPTSPMLLQEDNLLPPLPGRAKSRMSISPFTFSPAGSTFISPRNSARLSVPRDLISAARKRTLSVSPLSLDGVDVNTLIRISPNSFHVGNSLRSSPLE